GRIGDPSPLLRDRDDQTRYLFSTPASTLCNLTPVRRNFVTKSTRFVPKAITKEENEKTGEKEV
ncbi:Hypothetical predicted protein, partial [Cloeon dipterum]